MMSFLTKIKQKKRIIECEVKKYNAVTKKNWNFCLPIISELFCVFLVEFVY